MRIVLKFEVVGELKIPLHYNHLVQGMIYRSLDEMIATWYHNEGFAYQKRRFKLFTFSRLLSSKRKIDRKNKELVLSSPITLKIGSMDSKLLESLAIYLVRKGEVELNGTRCRFASIEVEMPVEAKGPVLVRAISPITIYSTLYGKDGSKKTYYYNPWEKEFEIKIKDNLRRKALAYYGKDEELPSLEGAYIRPVKVSKNNEAIVNFKGTWIRGWTGIYELNLPEPYFTLAYNAGLGSKNSQGFGMLEVLKDKVNK